MAAIAARPSNRVLDALEHAVGAILLQTGAVFDDPDYSDSRKFSRTKLRLERVLPHRLVSVHDALDSLEADLLRARSIINHDLTEARKSRLADEQSKAQAIAASNAPPPTSQQSDDVKASESQSIKKDEQQSNALAPDADIIMIDEPTATTSLAPASAEDKQNDQTTSQTVGTTAQPPAATSQPQHAEVKAEQETEKSAQGQAQAEGSTVGTKAGDGPVTTDNKTGDDNVKKDNNNTQKSEAAAADTAPDSSMQVDGVDTNATVAADGDPLLSNLDMFASTGAADGLHDVGNFDMPNPGEDMNTTDFLENDGLGGDFSGFGDMAGQEFDLDSFLNMDGDANKGGTDFSKIEFDDDFFNT